MSNDLFLTTTSLPLVIELFADATSVGKTTAAMRLRAFLETRGVPTTVIRIESKGIANIAPQLRPSDVFIATEDFAKAGSVPGGLAGVLSPMFAAIMAAAGTKVAILVDWAGGQAQLREQMLVSTWFSDQMEDLKVTALSVAVTTAAPDKMRQTSAALTSLRAIAPKLKTGLLLNAYRGDFKFLPGSEQAAAYQELQTAAAGALVIRFPLIEGDSWGTCEAAGYTMPELLVATPTQVAARIKRDRFVAAACLSECSAWWAATEKELDRVLRFREDAAQPGIPHNRGAQRQPARARA